MDNSLERSEWEPIHGFASLAEYERFVKFIEVQLKDGYAVELPVDQSYGPGEIYGGRWFRCRNSGMVWRLVEPDFPFKGLWEPVV